MVVGEVVERGKFAVDSLGTKFTLERVCQLKKVAVIKGGVQAFVELVVGGGVQRVRVRPLAVIAVDDLAHQPQVGIELVDEGAQLAQEIKTERVSGIQADAVDLKLFLPHADGVKQVLPGGRFGEIELYQVEVSVPGGVTERIAKGGALVEAQVGKPILVSGVLTISLQVAKRPEVASNVVEDAIKHQAHAACLQLPGKFCQFSAGAKPAVDVEIIGSVIAVAAGLEHRSKVKCVGAQHLNVIEPTQDLTQAGLGIRLEVVEMRRTACSERINVIKNAVLIDSGHVSSELYRLV